MKTKLKKGDGARGGIVLSAKVFEFKVIFYEQKNRAPHCVRIPKWWEFGSGSPL